MPHLAQSTFYIYLLSTWEGVGGYRSAHKHHIGDHRHYFPLPFKAMPGLSQKAATTNGQQVEPCSTCPCREVSDIQRNSMTPQLRNAFPTPARNLPGIKHHKFSVPGEEILFAQR